MQEDETLESGDPKPAVVAAPGGHVGTYEIVRAVGAGGMGTVKIDIAPGLAWYGPSATSSMSSPGRAAAHGCCVATSRRRRWES